MVVGNDIVIVDGGSAGIDSGYVAGVFTGYCLVVGNDAVVIAFVHEWKFLLLGGSVCRAAHRHSGLLLVCKVVVVCIRGGDGRQ